MNNRKRVKFDENNKLIIVNDNAEITTNGAISKISGTYEIDDEDVKKLFSIVNDKTLLQTDFYGIVKNRYITTIFTTDEGVHALLKDLSDTNNQLDDELEDLRKRYSTLKGNFDKVLEEIKKYNKYRLFKIKID